MLRPMLSQCFRECFHEFFIFPSFRCVVTAIQCKRVSFQLHKTKRNTKKKNYTFLFLLSKERKRKKININKFFFILLLCRFVSFDHILVSRVNRALPPHKKTNRRKKREYNKKKYIYINK